MKNLALIMFLISLNLSAEETCTTEQLNLKQNSTTEEIIYYTGTCHFRNKSYQKAAHNWKKLISMKIAPEQLELQVNAMNNLGFLYYMDWGVKGDVNTAISYWKRAISFGHIESEYHLCHSYSNKELSVYNTQLARMHCNKAQLLYQALNNKNNDAQQILDEINTRLKSVSK
jgi:TPR repeat protein